MKVFSSDKKNPSDYQGARSAKDIVEFALKEAAAVVRARLAGKAKAPPKASATAGSKASQSGSAGGSGKVIDATESSFKADVIDNDDLVIVEFFGTTHSDAGQGCGPDHGRGKWRLLCRLCGRSPPSLNARCSSLCSVPLSSLPGSSLVRPLQGPSQFWPWARSARSDGAPLRVSAAMAVARMLTRSLLCCSAPSGSPRCACAAMARTAPIDPCTCQNSLHTGWRHINASSAKSSSIRLTLHCVRSCTECID